MAWCTVTSLTAKPLEMHAHYNTIALDMIDMLLQAQPQSGSVAAHMQRVNHLQADATARQSRSVRQSAPCMLECTTTDVTYMSRMYRSSCTGKKRKENTTPLGNSIKGSLKCNQATLWSCTGKNQVAGSGLKSSLLL